MEVHIPKMIVTIAKVMDTLIIFSPLENDEVWMNILLDNRKMQACE